MYGFGLRILLVLELWIPTLNMSLGITRLVKHMNTTPRAAYVSIVKSVGLV